MWKPGHKSYSLTILCVQPSSNDNVMLWLSIPDCCCPLQQWKVNSTAAKVINIVGDESDLFPKSVFAVAWLNVCMKSVTHMNNLKK